MKLKLNNFKPIVYLVALFSFLLTFIIHDYFDVVFNNGAMLHYIPEMVTLFSVGLILGWQKSRSSIIIFVALLISFLWTIFSTITTTIYPSYWLLALCWGLVVLCPFPIGYVVALVRLRRK